MAADVEEIKAFSRAIKDGDVQTVLQLQDRHAELATTVTALGPWLCMAARYPSVEMIRALVACGADPSLTEKGTDANALGCAASAGRLENLNYFLGLDVELDVSGTSANPLFGAIWARAPSVAEVLLAAGIDSKINYAKSSARKWDAIAFAVEHGARDIAKMIARHQVGDDPAEVDALIAEADETARVNNAT